MSIRVASTFRGQWSCFFATTYSIELELFDEYLFRRLGEPPLNATILCDFERLAHRLEEMDPEDSRRLQRANRDYLLRGVTAGTSFHPKTYFFANAKEGLLLVGSGNLTLRGIEEGHEVFSRFESRRDEDIGSIRAWRDWMDEVVRRLDDRDVQHRWLDVKERTREWLAGAAEGSLFVSNLETSFLDHITADTSPGVSELHALAPFYDRNGQALDQLLQRTQPRTLHLYLPAATSVDGQALTKVLQGFSGQLELKTFEPAEFVHAKLVGIVDGNNGRLLSGSPNFSLAAFTSTIGGTPYANVEAGVLVSTTAENVRAAFRPPGLTVHSGSLALAADLEYSTDDVTGVSFPLKLRAARRMEDDRVAVDIEGTAPDALFLSAGLDSQRLVEGRSENPIALPEGGAVIWICDSEGQRLSNRVLLDDPASLRAWLQEREAAGERPKELDPLDANQPVGQLLLWLHRECIFDIDESPAALRARRLANEDANEDTGWGFLEELTKEELRLDPRVDRYRHASATGLPDDDEVLGLLRMMLDLTPAPSGLHLVGPAKPEGPDDPKPGTPWTTEQRLRVRVFNVLERWCGALGDPRFVWIDPAAPIRNYSALLAGLARCWEEEFLPVERVTRLLETLFSALIRSERATGYLGTISEDERKKAISRLPREARVLASALLYAVLGPSAPWRDAIFRFQPAVIGGLELGVFEVGPESARLVKKLVDEEVTAEAIEERLLYAAEFTDDEHWCARQERELGFKRVLLTHRGFRRDKFGITLAVDGASLADPRLVSLVRQALAYRQVEGAVVELGETRLAVRIGDTIAARLDDGGVHNSADVIDANRLADAERHGVSFAQLLNLQRAAA